MEEEEQGQQSLLSSSKGSSWAPGQENNPVNPAAGQPWSAVQDAMELFGDTTTAPGQVSEAAHLLTEAVKERERERARQNEHAGAPSIDRLLVSNVRNLHN